MTDENQDVQISHQVKGMGNLSYINKEMSTKKTCNMGTLLVGGAVGLTVGILVPFNVLFATELGMFCGLITGIKIKKKRKNCKIGCILNRKRQSFTKMLLVYLKNTI